MKRERLVENNLVGAFIAVMGIAALFIAGDWAAQEPNGWVSVGSIVGMAMSIASFALTVRFVRAAVELHPGVFRVRNYLRTFTLPIQGVRQFRLSTSRRLHTEIVVAELDGGREVPLNALGPGPLRLSRQRQRLEAALGRLNATLGQSGPSTTPR